MLSCSSLRQTFHTHRGSVHQAAELVTALLKVARVTAGLAESNSSLPPGFWLMSLAGWLPRTGISSGTLRLVFEYGLLFYTLCVCVHVWFSCCPWMPSPTFVIFWYLLLTFASFAFLCLFFVVCCHLLCNWTDWKIDAREVYLRHGFTVWHYHFLIYHWIENVEW